jgi:hypothetical protein
LWLLLFALAFAGLEAAVVVALRALVDPGGALFPLVRLPGWLLPIEQGREVGTLGLLGLAAWRAGNDTASRWAAFLVLFGAWDLLYYAALRLLIGWPPGLGAFDLLFLVPVPWLAPVWAPMLVAATMLVCGSSVLVLHHRNGGFTLRWLHWVGVGLGAAVVLATFLRPDHTPPPRYRSEILLLGLAIGLAAFADARRLQRATERSARGL